VKNMPTYEELPAQNSALKRQVKYLGNQTEKVEKKYEQAQSEIKNLTLHNKELIANYNWILEQLKLSKKKIYGSSAEKIAEDYGQLNLFNEAELERQPLTVEPKLEEITYKRRKSLHLRRLTRKIPEKKGNTLLKKPQKSGRKILLIR
jgi:hypothetical protein